MSFLAGCLALNRRPAAADSADDSTVMPHAFKPRGEQTAESLFDCGNSTV
jgi:hypothetical protein